MCAWISVNDKPQDNDIYCIVAEINNGEVYSFAPSWYLNGKFCCEPGGLEAYNYDGSAVIKLNLNITHWMPLPKPPKDDDNV